MLGLGVAVSTPDRSPGKEPCLVHYLSRNLQQGYTLHTIQPFSWSYYGIQPNKKFQQRIKVSNYILL